MHLYSASFKFYDVNGNICDSYNIQMNSGLTQLTSD